DRHKTATRTSSSCHISLRLAGGLAHDLHPLGRKESGNGAQKAPSEADEADEDTDHEALGGRRDARVAEELEVSTLHEPDATEADRKRVEEVADRHESDVVNELRLANAERVPGAPDRDHHDHLETDRERKRAEEVGFLVSQREERAIDPFQEVRLWQL